MNISYAINESVLVNEFIDVLTPRIVSMEPLLSVYREAAKTSGVAAAFERPPFLGAERGRVRHAAFLPG